MADYLARRVTCERLVALLDIYCVKPNLELEIETSTNDRGIDVNS